MFDERRVVVRGIELNCASATGRVPSVVLVHGVLRRWTTFLPLFPSLASRWRIVAIDQRGHGHSARATANSYHVVDYVGDLVDFLERHVTMPTVLYGHSLGAMVVAGAAAARPDLVRAVVLEDPPFESMGNRIRDTSLHGYFAQLHQMLPFSGGVAALAARLAEITLTEPSTGRTWQLGSVRDAVQLRFQAACLLAVDPAVFEPIVAGRWLAGYDWQQVLSAVRVPALVLQADEAAGGMLLAADAARAGELLVEGTVVHFAGAGHSLHTARTVEVTNLVSTFLESLN